MKKHLRLVMLSSLITTSILIVLIGYILLGKKETLSKENIGDIGEIGKLQVDQGQQIQNLQTQYDQKIEIQNNLLTEYDLKMKELETMQTDLIKNVTDMQESINNGMIVQTENQNATENENTQEQPTAPTEETQVIELPQQENKSLTINSADGLNLRNVASSDGGSLELIPNGSQVTILEGPQYNGGYNWYKVQTPNGNVGWIAKEFTIE